MRLPALIALCASLAPLFADPPGASISTKVQVPPSMSFDPFETDRYLNIPPRFSISVYARVGGARFLAMAPNGDLLVSQPFSGQVLLLRPNEDGDPAIFTFIDGLNLPHDIVFHPVRGVMYVYIAEANQIDRFPYNPGDTSAHDREVVVANLPSASSRELRGAYQHELKNIALDGNDNLYVSVASATNASPSDRNAQPARAAIYIYNADGSGGRLFAQGLRNAEGIRLLPGTNTLWAAVNNRDNTPYPYDDPAGIYGQVTAAYVDDHPPDEFTRVRDGGDYGWPYVNPDPDTASGFDQMPFDPDFDNNPGGVAFPVALFDRIDKGIPAHSAPLGLTFLHDTAFSALYRQGALIALHGSWNRTLFTGYKLIYFPFDSTGTPGSQLDLVTGWLDDSTQQYWGRPVSTAVDQQGNLFISDDQSGTIYKLSSAPIGTGGGFLSGTVSDGPVPADLTQAGTIDWLHWSNEVNRKANVDVALTGESIAAQQLYSYFNDPRTIYWSDGTPAQADSRTTGVFVAGQGSGFVLTAPADATHRTMTVFVGGYESNGTLTAQLSDGSAAQYVDTSVLGSVQYTRAYELTFNAASPGQILVVTWTQASEAGNITLSAAALR
jgi:glucose/arabinose dehydrogenase